MTRECQECNAYNWIDQCLECALPGMLGEFGVVVMSSTKLGGRSRPGLGRSVKVCRGNIYNRCWWLRGQKRRIVPDQSCSSFWQVGLKCSEWLPVVAWRCPVLLGIAPHCLALPVVS
jgi:hypothetical protein